MKFKAVIFDLDGTLVDSLEDIADSMNSVLQNHNFPTHSIETIQGFIGNGLKKLVRRAIPETHQDEKTIEQCYSSLMEVYRDHCTNKTKTYDGITSLLDVLASQNLKMAVLSNKADELTNKVVKELFSQWNFEFIVGLKNEAHKKPNPMEAIKISEGMGIQPEEILYVGDSDVDMLTATNAGMNAVGVSWGFRTKEELALSGAKHLIDHPMELVQIL